MHHEAQTRCYSRRHASIQSSFQQQVPGLLKSTQSGKPHRFQACNNLQQPQSTTSGDYRTPSSRQDDACPAPRLSAPGARICFLLLRPFWALRRHGALNSCEGGTEGEHQNQENRVGIAEVSILAHLYHLTKIRFRKSTAFPE